MMDQTFAANLLAWSGQATVIAAVAAALLGGLRVTAPGVRHTWWRTVLLLCLVLPFVQPWHTGSTASVAESTVTAPAIPDQDARASATAARPAPLLPTSSPVRSWPAMLGAVLVAGAVLRFAWLGAGLLRLRRLRGAGRRAEASGSHEELQKLTAAGAEIRYVPVLGQPVTFGLRRPVVLLPESLTSMSEAVQRAVLAHELWHVRRRDWAWILVEECVRASLWFHPAIWFVVSRIQSSREEVVDELTVLATSSRRSYLEALLAFADEPPLFAAAPFARRRHLFQRMLLISREAVMSPKRIVASSIAMLAILLLSGWYAATALPLVASATPGTPAAVAVAPGGTPSMQQPPRDHRPGEARPATLREQELQATVAKDPAAPASRLAYFEIAKLQEARGALDQAEATLQAARAAFPSDQMVLMTVASFYNRAGQFDRAVSIVEEAAAIEPSNPRGHQLVATYYQEKVQKDQSLTPTDRLTYIQKGIDATDRALAMNPEYVDALIYKNILMRRQAGLETDQVRRAQLLAEADLLRNRAMELNKARGGVGGGVPGGVPGGVVGGVVGGVEGGLPPPPPPPPPPMPADRAGLTIDGVAPMRVGGNIKAPVKIKDVQPAYPAEAMDARVQGVVIAEVIIDGTGRVREARVLRSIPMLDESALEAIRQWEFTPTLLNGAPVPVIMTVTVNFTLQ